MSSKCGCGCACGSQQLKLIFPCSGAADVGEIADRVGRKLNREGKGKMFCVVGIGGRVSGIMATTEAAGKILAIDGCPLACVQNSLEQAGFKTYAHLKLWELGLKKGEAAVTDAVIDCVAAEAAKLLA